ncbi:MAG: metallophosphoesterase, partial [Candidatus Omnitrophica bacterium]|nr:metallophosphoesterase [Candidatus Omnitrophota bacterium]
MITLSFADLHSNPAWWEKTKKILDFVKEKAIEVRPDFITHSGDFHDCLVTNSDRHHLPEIKRELDEISEIAPIVMIYGTPNQHDVPGSLDIFEGERIKIARPEIPLIFNGVIFYCIPDARPFQSIDESNPLLAEKEINQYLKNLCLYYGAHRREHPDLPAVVLGHGMVKNTRNQDIDVIKHSAIYTTESDLQQIGADLYLFGHYHKPFAFETLPGGMLGGMAHNWNDIDYSPAIHEYNINAGLPTVHKEHRIPFIPRRIKLTEFLIDPFDVP